MKNRRIERACLYLSDVDVGDERHRIGREMKMTKTVGSSRRACKAGRKTASERARARQVVGLVMHA